VSLIDIRLLAVDIDGVLTDGTVEICDDGVQYHKSICFQDMDAVARWKKSGKKLAIITGVARSSLVEGIVGWFEPDAARYKAEDKLLALRMVCRDLKIPLQNTCYIGDADRDAPAIKAAEVGVAPRNATIACKVVADKVLERAGGEGCIQELIDWIEKGVEKNVLGNSCSALMQTGVVIGPRLKRASGIIAECLSEGGKILVVGNGGSAADAQHFVAELVGRFKEERSPLPAIALTTNTSILTAVGNDYSFDEIFVRQIEALATDKDVLVAISTSGNSENVIRAIETAKEKKGCKVIALTGKGGGRLGEVGKVSLLLDVESNDTPRIQECHIAILHTLCEMIEDRILV